jgi:hypothetical protein
MWECVTSGKSRDSSPTHWLFMARSKGRQRGLCRISSVLRILFGCLKTTEPHPCTATSSMLRSAQQQISRVGGGRAKTTGTATPQSQSGGACERAVSSATVSTAGSTAAAPRTARPGSLKGAVRRLAHVRAMADRLVLGQRRAWVPPVLGCPLTKDIPNTTSVREPIPVALARSPGGSSKKSTAFRP